jgi:hypothetical protein
MSTYSPSPAQHHPPINSAQDPQDFFLKYTFYSSHGVCISIPLVVLFLFADRFVPDYRVVRSKEVRRTCWTIIKPTHVAIFQAILPRLGSFLFLFFFFHPRRYQSTYYSVNFTGLYFRGRNLTVGSKPSHERKYLCYTYHY